MAEIIVALDVPSAREALALMDRLPGVGWVKVGPMLSIEGGPALLREITARGAKIFLDLKWHDIPHAVEGAVRAGARAGASLATVHALGGREMLQQAHAVAKSEGLRLAAVSVLTSHSPASYAAATGRSGLTDVGPEVTRLAAVARDAGLSAMVCSVHEAASVRALMGTDAWIVTPGIRAPGDAAGDQARVADPATAVAAGATHLVVGRPITGAADPGSAYRAFVTAGSALAPKESRRAAK
jgi:orotidine-5'-phosphate decarboxylase